MAVRKAMTWEYVSRQTAVFHTDQERFGLRDGTIPPNTLVWLAGHTGPETFYTKVGNAFSPPGFVPELKCHITTFTYERLVIQVISIRPDEYTDAYTFLNCNQRVFGEAIIRIWPTVDRAFWPPGTILDDGVLDSFHNRCSEYHQDEHEA